VTKFLYAKQIVRRPSDAMLSMTLLTSWSRSASVNRSTSPPRLRIQLHLIIHHFKPQQSTFSEKWWRTWTDSHASHVFLVLFLLSLQYAKLATRRFLSITSDIVRCIITSCICPLIVWYNFHFRIHYTFLCCNLKAHCWLWCPLFQLLSAAATGQSGEMANCPTEFQIWDWMAVANER